MSSEETETGLVLLHVRVPRGLLAEVDAAREDLSRAAYVRRALRTQVDEEARLRQAVETALLEAAG